MGAVKQWLIEEHAKERRKEVREWLELKKGRFVSNREIDAHWDEFELEEAYEQDLDRLMSKD